MRGRDGAFAGIALFEWRYAARRPAFAAAALGLAALGALLSLSGPGSGAELRNGPYAVSYSAGFLGLVSVFAATLLSAPALLRDVEHRSAEIVFATAVGKRDYLLGRFASGVIYRRKWLNRRRLLWAEHYFSRHRVKAVFLSRFLPGSRPFTYIAAGLLNTPFWRLLTLVTCAALTQTTIYLFLARTVGAHLLPYLENVWLRMAVVGAVILVIVMIGLRLLRRYHQLEEEALLAAGALPEGNAEACAKDGASNE